ncbi:DUF2778 domain-containing protein [Rhizobiaceae bacterium n13]|uniref:DUF2778 domain-containing protein n=1 Tax=Ferirhizobium litorale TaxID=2927786 RepID=A0AAE3U2G2_9HYPH|nr:DUF2778 domain-containing protein [Fererhizobium litorale]MDI7863816.1 DUF2778 domain-containing protein [Fererhizobium litorale]MDI7924084.1 DUF2778 domain-containing protein [Fererhizobium litorale]
MTIAVEALNEIDPGHQSVVRPRRSRGFLWGALAVLTGFAASISAITVAAKIGTIATSSPFEQGARPEASLGLKPIVRDVPGQREVHVPKFGRLRPTPPDEIWPAGLTAAAIKASHHKRITLASTRALQEKVEQARTLALFTTTSGPSEQLDATVTGQSQLATALAPTSDTGSRTIGQPFSLVLQDQETAELPDDLPDTIPLPEARPKALARAETDVDAEPPTSKPRRAAEKVLAYARPDKPELDDEVEEEVRPSIRGRKGVAYYDISAAVVYMPNGERLEAHSGIGKMRDNPDYAHVKMRGPTPPGTYKVTMREKRFHGVEAVRLTPTNGVAPHGRVGLLAHSYLLRTRGDSHGCVAFEDYPRFLKAFKRGEITHMVIVDSMKGQPKQSPTLASIFSRKR